MSYSQSPPSRRRRRRETPMHRGRRCDGRAQSAHHRAAPAADAAPRAAAARTATATTSVITSMSRRERWRRRRRQMLTTGWVAVATDDFLLLLLPAAAVLPALQTRSPPSSRHRLRDPRHPTSLVRVDLVAARLKIQYVSPCSCPSCRAADCRPQLHEEAVRIFGTLLDTTRRCTGQSSSRRLRADRAARADVVVEGLLSGSKAVAEATQPEMWPYCSSASVRSAAGGSGAAGGGGSCGLRDAATASAAAEAPQDCAAATSPLVTTYASIGRAQ